MLSKSRLTRGDLMLSVGNGMKLPGWDLIEAYVQENVLHPGTVTAIGHCLSHLIPRRVLLQSEAWGWLGCHQQARGCGDGSGSGPGRPTVAKSMRTGGEPVGIRPQ